MTAHGETDQLRAIGHAVLGLVNAAILIAIIAVVLSTRAQTGAVIQQFFALLSWLVAQVMRPLQAAPPITLSSQLQPAGNYPVGGAGGTAGTGTGTTQGTTGTGTAPAPTGTTGAGNDPVGTVKPLCDGNGTVTGSYTVGYESLIPAGSHPC